MIFTSCAVAFAHGSNDVANAIGPLAAVPSSYEIRSAIIPKHRYGFVIRCSGNSYSLATLGIEL